MFNLSKDIDRLESQTPFRVGGALPFSKPYQSWIWEEDKFSIINKIFKETCGQMESKQ